MIELNYKRGEVIDVQEEFGVKQVEKNKYVGNKPLVKPNVVSKGAFGGNLAGQALLVAMKSADAQFKPHSLHSYFISAVNSEDPVEWEVEEISTGNNFCNRSVRGSQNGKTVYFANISLTKRNSYRESLQKYEEHARRVQERLNKQGNGGGNNDDDENDNDDDNVPQKPFRFQSPIHKWFQINQNKELPVSDIESNMLCYFKFFPEFLHLDQSKYEDDIPVAERRFAFMVRWGIDNEQGFHQPVKNVDEQFQYVGLGNLSDSLLLNVLLRVLRIEDVQLKDYHKTFFGVSLDHVLYIHDDDFDVTQWMGYCFKAIRFSHDRIIMEGELYNHNGIHVATVVQEGLIRFAGKEEGAKL
ncbi:uncharacterized protein LODBEIA_P01410 [Lodderomyces beijingensis]|uniref:Acyl-CoA thioesterase II n=1 Tax=Lodderomyces beijingensis TaxID=1775926 RepID=A0ABP0ZEM7_9ASCO